MITYFAKSVSQLKKSAEEITSMYTAQQCTCSQVTCWTGCCT